MEVSIISELKVTVFTDGEKRPEFSWNLFLGTFGKTRFILVFEGDGGGSDIMLTEQFTSKIH